MEEIKPTTIQAEDKPYTLEDKDYLLITAIQELTIAIKQVSRKL